MTKKLLLLGLGIALTAVSFGVAMAAANPVTIVSPINVASPVAASACPSFVRSLAVGVTGSDVTALQTYLNAQGYLSVNPTGYFGSLTQSAVAHWQAKEGVVLLGGSGSGIFGPLSRAQFSRSCGGTTQQGTLNFSAIPASGIAPLAVQFVVTAPQGTSVGNLVNFGDGASGTLGFAPVCSNCNLLATVSHTYATPGTYNATLTSGACACPANEVCNCPNIPILGTATITVTAAGSSGSSTTSGIQQLNAPGSVALATGGIAEIRNASFYFTLTNITASSATIDITRVGCWNSFPSDPTPAMRCMIAVVPTPPQTLSVGQNYGFGNYSITLTSLMSSTAMFSIQ
jgi:peptidoglycan hydrolase-like protein with peptidoglycan-binding domain